MKRLLGFLILFGLLLGGAQTTAAQSASDFSQPYGSVQRTVKQQPLLVILLGSRSSPYTPTWSQEQIRRLIFGATDSVAAYYLETSYGQFTFTEAYTTPWLTAQDEPATGDWDESTFAFIDAGGFDIERRKSAYVIQQVERQTPFRFSQWDTNNDGRIREDELSILWIYPQIGGGRERGIFPLPVSVPSLTTGVQILSLARVADGDDYLMPLIAHELGHVALHLDDLYADTEIGYLGNGGYTLMSNHWGTCDPKPAAGCLTAPHLDPWSKIKLGWLTPTVVTADGWYTLDNIETTPSAYILYNPAHGTREYFIVENRWPASSFEHGLPDQGLAIWHIDERYAGGDRWGRHTIHLERARGMGDSEQWATLWEGADPLRDYAFTPGSYPASGLWQDGSSSSIAISCVSASGPTMTAFFDVRPLRESRQFVSAPAVANSSDGRMLNLFALAGNGYVTQTTYVRGGSVGWTDWTWLPGSLEFTGAPAVVNSPDGSLVDVFATGKDGNIYEIAYARGAGGWQDWTQLPGGVQFVSAPAALNSPDGSVLDVFATGYDGNLYEIVYARGGGGWGSWPALPGGIPFPCAPAVVNAPGGTVLDIFAMGVDGRLYELVYVRFGGGWGNWQSVPGPVVASAPAVINSPDGNLLDVFALGRDGNLYEVVYVRGGAGWQNWQPVTESTAACS